MNWDKEWALQAHMVKLLKLSKKDPKWWSQLCMKEHVQDNMVEIQKQNIIPQEKSCAEIPLNGVWKAPEVWIIVHLSMLSPCVYNSRESPKHKGGVVLSKKDKSVWSRGQILTAEMMSAKKHVFWKSLNLSEQCGMIHVTELMKGVETTKEEKSLNELRDNAEMEQTRTWGELTGGQSVLVKNVTPGGR